MITLATRFAIEGGMDKETAETMLRYSDMSIPEIASVLAFSSQSHFTEALKRRTGMTSREYRNRFSTITLCVAIDDGQPKSGKMISSHLVYTGSCIHAL